MANERITENFFRKFILQDESYKNNKFILPNTPLLCGGWDKLINDKNIFCL